MYRKNYYNYKKNIVTQKYIIKYYYYNDDYKINENLKKTYFFSLMNFFLKHNKVSYLCF